jgi:hypothetical protein
MSIHGDGATKIAEDAEESEGERGVEEPPETPTDSAATACILACQRAEEAGIDTSELATHEHSFEMQYLYNKLNRTEEHASGSESHAESQSHAVNFDEFVALIRASLDVADVSRATRTLVYRHSGSSELLRRNGELINQQLELCMLACSALVQVSESRKSEAPGSRTLAERHMFVRAARRAANKCRTACRSLQEALSAERAGSSERSSGSGEQVGEHH